MRECAQPGSKVRTRIITKKKIWKTELAIIQKIALQFL